MCFTNATDSTHFKDEPKRAMGEQLLLNLTSSDSVVDVIIRHL